MKKYYTKYLPVEGDLKIGDITFWDLDEGYFSKQFVRVTESFIIFAECYNWKKYELFLCSKDIKIGDHAMELLTNGEYDTFQIDTENDIFHDMIAYKRQFKIIGKLSKEAFWVKEGDEFNENEINPQWYDDSGSYDASWFNINNNKFFNEDDIIDEYLYSKKSYFDYIKSDIKRVQVKGPCGHFH